MQDIQIDSAHGLQNRQWLREGLATENNMGKWLLLGQSRQWNAARRSLNTIPQPQFQAPPDPSEGNGQQAVPPLYRGGAYYPGLHPKFIPRGVSQPLLMHLYPNLPRNSVANH